MIQVAQFVGAAASAAHMPGLEHVARTVADLIRGMRETPTGNYSTGGRGKLIQLYKQPDGSYK